MRIPAVIIMTSFLINCMNSEGDTDQNKTVDSAPTTCKDTMAESVDDTQSGLVEDETNGMTMEPERRSVSYGYL